MRCEFPSFPDARKIPELLLLLPHKPNFHFTDLCIQKNEPDNIGLVSLWV